MCSPNFQAELNQNPSFPSSNVTAVIQVPPLGSSFGTPSLSSSLGPPLLTPQIHVPSVTSSLQVPSLPSLGPVNHLASMAQPRISIGAISLASNAAPMASMPSAQTGLGSSLGAGLSVKIDTKLGTQSVTDGPLSTQNMNAEVAVKLNMKGLDSSEDEDLSAGASGGCTGEPQQYSRV